MLNYLLTGIKNTIKYKSNNVCAISRIIRCSIYLSALCRTSSLQKSEGTVFCADKACEKFEEPLNIVNSKPVLIDFNHSLTSEQSYKSYSGKSIVPRRPSLVVHFIRAIFVGKSKKSIQNLDYLKKEMLRIKCPRILIIGGGELGSGMDDFYSEL